MFKKITLAFLASFTLMVIGLTAATVSAAPAYNQPESKVEQSASPTPGDDGFQLPTATSTPIGGPTATPTRTPTIVPVQAETIGDPTTNLRTGPGLEFDVVAELPPGTILPILGRWLGYDWLLVGWDDSPNGEAWVFQPLVLVQGDITTIPAVTPPAAPTENPTLVAAEATATVLLQTPGAVQTATAEAQALLAQSNAVTTQTPQPDNAAGRLPTFTPAPSYVPPNNIAPPQTAQEQSNGGIPPAVIIISLGIMGILSLLLGVIRRLV